jgi:MoaA/NifB/PqqE/SkfB family radical SAM enzyme
MYEKINNSFDKVINIYNYIINNFPNIQTEFRLIEGIANYYTKNDLLLYNKLIENKHIESDYLLNNKLVSYYDLIFKDKNISRVICNAGEDAVYIDYNGNIEYCLQTDNVVGNIYNSTKYIKYNKHLCLNGKNCTCNFDVYRCGVEL